MASSVRAVSTAVVVVVVAAVLAGSAAAAAALASPGGAGSVHFPAWSALQERAQGAGADLADLAVALGQHLPAAAGGNALLSPLSVAAVLAALQMGARGDTAREIGLLLGQQGAGSQAYWAQLGDTLRAISNATSVIANAASALFVDATFPLNEEYRRNVRQVLASDEFSVDFARDRFSAVAAVNGWVSAATRGRIARVLEDVSDDAALVVASAVYFNGAWQQPFPAKLTRPEPFRVSPTEERTVQMMTHAARVPYAYSYDLRCQVLGLPYKGGEFAMFVLLPEDEGEAGARRLGAALTPASLLQLLASARERDDVIYMLPRFSLEASYSLKQPLQAAGLRRLFDPLQADLSGLVADDKLSAVGRSRLSVSEVVHRVRVEVTETGTEAVAATVAWVTRTTHPTVRADRPFLFAIQHLPSRALLFWGTVVRP
ncbi:leukocyte elastase inhibitor-like [Schistocerca cancellata]|uniref:leukocyte elastase inhibitor-like n=1 Tax=Schistocerca cancellata TaxID=274614 RepID=UPI002118AB73|nr:leukocyte elastase inhibitor-like [Schistocerca cancellata]